jgi:hypothetical protein
LLTAQKRLSDGDQAKNCQLLFSALNLADHSTPFGEVITRFPLPVLATAQNRLNSDDQTTDRH